MRPGRLLSSKQDEKSSDNDEIAAATFIVYMGVQTRFITLRLSLIALYGLFVVVIYDRQPSFGGTVMIRTRNLCRNVMTFYA